MQEEPKQQFENLKKRIIEEIDAIDKQVPWSEKEPSWWLEMVDIRRTIQNTIKN